MGDLSQMVTEAPFTIIAGAIQKDRLRERYRTPDSPYDLALKFCLERLFLHLQDEADEENPVPVIVERRGKKEDSELELVFRRVSDGANAAKERFPFSVHFADKLSNSSGLQFADLVARPIGRWVMDPNQDNRVWEVLKPKFRRSPRRELKGWGLKKFPRV